MSKLLIEESPLTFQPSLAIKIGLNEAIVLQQVHYWINNPKNKGYEQDGFKWVYNTYAEWKEANFPFWSENTIQRTFSNLEDAGLIVSIQPMKGKYDRTKYYRIDHTKLDMFDDPKLVRSLDESEITTENTTNTYVLNAQDLRQVNAKVDAIITNSQNPNNWEGRERFLPEHLPLVDWYHKATGQECTKKLQKVWWMAVNDWMANNLTVKDLQAAYDTDIVWKKFFKSPVELTQTAIALKVKPKEQANSIPEHLLAY